MKLAFTPIGWDEYLAWQAAEPTALARVNALIEACRRTPFQGIGKPEPLKRDLQGWWSRRITQEHRLVYRVTGSGPDQRLEIAHCRYHY